MSICGKMKREASVLGGRVVLAVEARKKLFADQEEERDPKDGQNPREIRERCAFRREGNDLEGECRSHRATVAAGRLRGQGLRPLAGPGARA